MKLAEILKPTMSDYSHTKSRVLQWIGIMLVLAVFGGAYWYFQVFAGYKTSTGQTGMLTSGLVGIWSFDGADTTSTVATDRSGSSNTGTISGATVTPGKVGQALSFDGVDDSVNAGNAASLQLTTGTISAWIKTTGAGSSYRAIVVKGNAYGLFLKDNVLMLYDWGASAERTTGMNLADGNWHYVTQVFQSGVASGTTVYVDGSLVLTTTMTVSSQAVALGIGDSIGNSQFFAGSIDEPRVYNRVLTASEIQSLYQSGESDKVNATDVNGNLNSGLAGYWKLDEGSGTSTVDSSVNGNNGTLTNGPTWGTGQLGSAVTFDGTNDYVTAGSSSALDFSTNTYTLSAWIYPTAIPGLNQAVYHDSIFDRWDHGCTGHGYAFGITNAYTFNGPTELEVRTSCGGSSTSIANGAANVLTNNQWYHIVAVANAGVVTFYVNGTPYAATGNVTDSPLTYGGPAVIGNDSTNGSPFTGSIDEVRVYSRPLSPAEVMQLYRVTAPGGLDYGLVGNWTFNGTDLSGTKAYDRSGAGNTGTLTNGPSVTPGKVGQALSFDGVDDYVTAGDPSALEFGTGDFSISFWMKTTSTALEALVTKRWSADCSAGWAINNRSADTLQITITDGTNCIDDTSVSMKGIQDGRWHYVVAAFDRDAVVSVYMDGILSDQTSSIATVGSVSNARNFDISRFSTGTYYFTGSLDEVRAYNRVLSASEIQSLYASGQSDEVNTGASQAQGGSRLDSGLAGYWKMDDGSGTNATDSSTNGNTGTLANGPTWTTGQIGSAVDFDGTDDYMSATLDGTTLTQLSVSFWMNCDLIGSTQNGIFQWANSLSSNYPFVAVFKTQGQDSVRIYLDGDYRQNNIAITNGTWTHITLTLNTANLWSFYKDGSFVGTYQDDSTHTYQSNAATLYFANGAAPSYFDGKLDEARIYTRTLSADEVAELYRLSAPTGTDTSLKGYWSFNGKDISGTTAYDRSGVGNNGTLTNGPAVTPGKIGQALEFDGSNDRVAIASSGSALNLTSALTYSAWIYPQTFGGGSLGRIIDKNVGNSGVFLVDNSNITSGLGFGYNGGGLVSSNNNAITLNKWQHVVVTYNSGTVAFYVDGTLNIGGLSAGGLASDTGAFAIGERSNGAADRGFDGYIDEVRVYNRALTASEISALYNAGR